MAIRELGKGRQECPSAHWPASLPYLLQSTRETTPEVVLWPPYVYGQHEHTHTQFLEREKRNIVSY